MYTHSYSLNTDICLHIHTRVPLGCLIKQAGIIIHRVSRRRVPGNTGNRTRDIWLDKCISNQQLYQLSYSTTLLFLYQSQLGRLSGSRSLIEKSEVLFLPGFELGTSGSWGERITTTPPHHLIKFTVVESCFFIP